VSLPAPHAYQFRHLMRVIPPDELVELIALFVTLMIFFSIDAKHRFSKNRDQKEYSSKTFFAGLSITGAIATVVAAVITWIDFFLPEENTAISLIYILVPGSIAFLAALGLGVDVLIMRMSPDEPDDDSK